MFSFYPSATHARTPLYSARSRYSDDIICLHPSISAYSSIPRTTHSESRYHRALAEYLAAEEELLRARQEATLKARAEALRRRQEEARLLQARTIRAREVRQVQRLKQLLAQRCAIALAAQTTSPEVHLSLYHGVPIACSVPERRGKPESSVFTPKRRISFMGGNPLFDSIPVEESRPKRRRADFVPENGALVSNLESILQARLQKVASDNEDKEVQDLARATLQHLVQHTADKKDTSARSSETTLDSVKPLHQDTDLSRSDALQGNAAEAAKASFKAHREAIGEQAVPPVSPVAPLEAIQDIRATLSKLSADFSIPPSLDFSDDEADGLAYTPTNAPIRVYEHALEGLLTRLDAVESDGDEEVRVARRSVVKEVETALEGVDTEVKRAREVAKDHRKPGQNDLAETITSSSDLVEEEDTYKHTKTKAKTQTDEALASVPSHNSAASYSSFAPVSAPEVDDASFAADVVDVVPDNSAIEDTCAEESTEVVTESASSSSPATVQDEVIRIHMGDVSVSLDSNIAQPEHEASVSPTSETREEGVSVSSEGFIFTSTPVSPAIPSPSLPDGVDDEDGWSEVEA